MLYFLTIRYGLIGGAIAWVVLNSGYVLISISIMHTRLLKEEKWRWYLKDVGLPLIASLIIAGLGRLFMLDQMSQIMTVFYLIIISTLTLLAAAFVTPTTREWLANQIINFKLHKKIKWV